MLSTFPGGMCYNVLGYPKEGDAFEHSEQILEDCDKTYGIKTQSVAEITKVCPGYAVQETENGKNVYNPTLVLYGDVSLRDLLGSQPEIYTLLPGYPEGETLILAVNAIDGSIITR